MANYLVTGGSGFVGTHLVGRLLREGNRLWCLTRHRKENRHEDEAVEWLEGDLSDEASYKHVLKEVDAVFHLAGLLNAKKKEEYIRVNVESTRTLLEACRRNAATLKRFIYMSSIAAMGPRDNGALLRESDSCNPLTEYGKSKLQAEEVVAGYACSLPVITLRPSFIYGEQDTRSLAYLRSFFDKSSPVRASAVKTVSFCYISDVVHACMLSLGSGIEPGGVFIISEPGAYVLDEVPSILRTVLINLARHEPPRERARIKTLLNHLSQLKALQMIGKL